MKYIDEIKNAIAEVIKPNGNQEITGQVLQDILVSVVGKLGESFDSQIGERTDIRESINVGNSSYIKIGSVSGAPINIGTNNSQGASISISDAVSISKKGIKIGSTTIDTDFSVNIGSSVDIYNGAKIGTSTIIRDNVTIGAGGVVIPDSLTIGYDKNNENFYLGTGLNYDSSSLDDSIMLLKYGLKITWDSAGITFRTPMGQIKLNYGS